MPAGLIVKALSGYYYVLGEDKAAGTEWIQCRARGVFKNRGISPLVGDRVTYELTENGEGTVKEVLPRTTELIRPPIANVDLAVLVFSVDEPALNLPLLDKFLVHTESAGLETLICLTKQDLLRDGDTSRVEAAGGLEGIRALYESMGYGMIITSSREGIGVEEVKSRLSGRISVFAGQSGVGKSSLLNAMMPNLGLETNEISMKLGRGKHTTRHVELIPLENGGLVADTPGFSQLDFLQVEAEGLSDCFPDFRPFAEQCRFRGCLHLHEPGCMVQEAQADGRIAPSRYTNYLQFLQEIRDKKRRY